MIDNAPDDDGKPQYVLTFPGTLSPQVMSRLREHVAEAIATGRPIVLPEGGMLYDAKNLQQPLPVVTSELASSGFPWWIAPSVLVALIALVAIAVNTAS